MASQASEIPQICPGAAAGVPSGAPVEERDAGERPSEGTLPILCARVVVVTAPAAAVAFQPCNPSRQGALSSGAEEGWHAVQSE